MYFRVESGVPELYLNGRAVFTKLRAYVMTAENEKTYLPFVSATAQAAVFSRPELGARLVFSVVRQDETYALRIKAEYRPHHFFEEKFHNHFYEENAAGVEMLPGVTEKAYTAVYRGSEWWSRVMVSQSFVELPVFTQALFLNFGDTECFAAAVCDEAFKGNFAAGEEGLCLYVWDNCLSDSCDTTAAVLGFGEDVYSLVSRVIAAGFAFTGRAVRMREDRHYPEILESLGWCSWDAFHLDVSRDGLLQKARELREKGVPVKWFMIDDMWGDVKNNALGVNSSRELNSFEADSERFPGGLKETVSRLKEEFSLTVGLWHPTTGYWNGLDPQGEIARDPAYRDLIYWSQEGVLVHSFEREKIREYYMRQHAFYKECGIDFVKIDNQACLRRYAKRVLPIGRAAKNLHDAIEETADRYYGGDLINCMGMSLENFWNRRSAVSRMSCDNLPGSRDRFNLLIRQNAFNGLVQGSVYYGDFDMWCTHDALALKNAAVHAVSGGPVYVSDEPGKTNPEIIRPLIFSNGKIIRMPDRALPCRDCFDTDPLTNGKPFKIFNRMNGCGVVIACNIDEEGKSVTGEACAADAGLPPDMDYCVYNRFTGTVRTVRGNEAVPVLLPGEDDFAMLLFLPLVDGKAIIGLKEKYVCFAALRDGLALDDGTLLVYQHGTLSEKPISKGETAAF